MSKSPYVLLNGPVVLHPNEAAACSHLITPNPLGHKIPIKPFEKKAWVEWKRNSTQSWEKF